MDTDKRAENSPAPFGEVNTEGDTKVSARGAAEDVMEDAKSRAAEIRDRAARQAQELGSGVRQRLETNLVESKDEVARQIESVARSVRRSGEELRRDDQEVLARYSDSLASGIEQIADYLRGKDARALLDDVGRLARRKPALFFGGVLAAGMLGARFLKSRPGSAGEKRLGTLPRVRSYDAEEGEGYGRE